MEGTIKNALKAGSRTVENKSLSAKELFVNRIKSLPVAVQAGLRNHSLKISDHEYYAIVKAAGAASIEMFARTLDQGLATNVHQGIVPTDEYFLCTSIVLVSDVAGASSAIADACALPFDELSPVIRNAKFSLKNGQDTYISKSSCGMFRRTEGLNLEVGEFKLENPKIFYSKKDISFQIEELGAAITAETWVKVRLKGVVTTKK